MATTTLPQRIAAVFADNRDRTFLIESMTNRSWTYGEFHEWALRAASMLRASGVKKGDHVALLLANSAEFAAMYFGCLFIGAVAVPVNQALHPDEIRYILSHCGSRLLLFSRCTRALLLQVTEGLNLRQVRVTLGQEQSFHPEDIQESWSYETAAVDPSLVPLDGVSDDAPLIVLFTSGTTGRPKGLVHAVRSEFGNAVAFNSAMGLGRDDRFLHIWPMAYSTGYLNTMLAPFMAGGSVVLSTAFTAQTILAFWKPVIKHGANALWLSPTMAASLVRMDRDGAGIDYCRAHIRTVCVGMAPFAQKLKKEFEAKYGVEALESYGLSELLIIAANVPAHPRREGSVGRLLPGVEFSTADAGDASGAGGASEILVRTPFSMNGYLDPDTGRVEALEADGWFRTGDIGHMDAGGNLYITGRKKDLIIRGGQNLSPVGIREVLLNHPVVDDAVVVGIPHDFYGEEVVAALRLKGEAKLPDERSSILQYCRRFLSQAAVPTQMLQVDEFPTGPTGKILTREVRSRVIASLAAR